MSTTDTLALLSEFLQKRAGTDPASITREASLADVNIDSLMLLELLFELEEKLGITVPNDFPTPGNVGELVDVVDRIRTQPSEQVH
jgi:acyl carrier protein